MFNVGHAATLEKAKACGTYLADHSYVCIPFNLCFQRYLIVGVFDDRTVNEMKGCNYPVMNLGERVIFAIPSLDRAPCVRSRFSMSAPASMLMMSLLEHLWMLLKSSLGVSTSELLFKDPRVRRDLQVVVCPDEHFFSALHPSSEVPCDERGVASSHLSLLSLILRFSFPALTGS